MKCQKTRPYMQYFAGMTIIMDITLVLMRVGWNGTECATLALHQTFHFFLIRIIPEEVTIKASFHNAPNISASPPGSLHRTVLLPSIGIASCSFSPFSYSQQNLLGSLRLNLISLQGALPERDASSFCWNTRRSQGNVLQQRGLSSYTLFGAYLV